MTQAVLTREAVEITTQAVEASLIGPRVAPLPVLRPALEVTTSPEVIRPRASAPASAPRVAPRPGSYAYTPYGPGLMAYWGQAMARSLDVLGFWTYLGIQAGPPTSLTEWTESLALMADSVAWAAEENALWANTR